MSNYFRFENEICPVCQQKFSGNDDIVVCPVCGTPHHRECYKKHGECGNFHKHNEGFRWSPNFVNEPTYQTENGTETQTPPFNKQPFNSQDAPSTAFFGNRPNPLALFPGNLEEDVLTDEVADFVQIRGLKYIQNFFYVKSKKRTFNWAAFFFTPYWFFYRKLYKLGAIFMAITLLLSVGFSSLPPVQRINTAVNEWSESYNAETTEEIQSSMDELSAIISKNRVGSALIFLQNILEIALSVFAGFYANKWYYNHSVTSIRNIKSEEPDLQKRRLLFFKSGGVSIGATFLALLASYTVTMAVDLLLTFIK